MKKTSNKASVNVNVNVNAEEVQKELIVKRSGAISKIAKGCTEKAHTKRYPHLYPGSVATLKALRAEGVDLKYNPDKPKDVNNRRIAELVVKKGFALGHLVKYPNSTKTSPYSADTFEDVLRELFSDTRGRRDGINELVGEDVGQLFLDCSAIAKQKYFRTISKEENAAMEDINKKETDA